MFGPFRRFPMRGLALVAIGFLLASVLAGGAPVFSGAAAGLGLALLFPLFLFKMFFLFFIFGSVLRFAGGGRGWGPGPHWGHGGPGHRSGGPSSEPDRERSDTDQRDWEESLRRAWEELREHDSPFSPPPEGLDDRDDRTKG